MAATAWGESADELRASVLQAYAGLDSLSERMAYAVELPGGQTESGEMNVVVNDGLVGVDMGEFFFFQRDGEFVVASGRDGGPYMSVESADFSAGLADATGGAMRIPVPPQIAAMGGAGEQALAAFGFGVLGELSPSGVDDTELDGEPAKALVLRSMTGSAKLAIDPATSLVRRVDISAMGGGMKAVMTIDPLPAAAERIERFDASERIRVDGIRGLMSAGPEIGFDASGLEFETPGGGLVRVSELKGSVVVLDFWATWCGNCFVSVPSLTRAANWASSAGIDAVFLPVNSRERFETDDERVAKASVWWDRAGSDLDWVLDVEDAAARTLSVSNFPALVILDQEGRVAFTHLGLDDGGEATLKREVLRLAGE